jgi:GNAT superfamily N-acetyltransferase
MIFRTATRADVPAIVALLADDALGRARETAAPEVYLVAFDELAANPMHQIVVGEEGGLVLACAQLTILHGLSHGGGKRALVEAVRVAAASRGLGHGAALMAEIEARARAAGAVMLQLTTDRGRMDAHRFYARLGFEASHLGMKKVLT